MNLKSVMGVLAVVLLAGLGVFVLVKSHAEPPGSGGDETATTLVTVQTGLLKLATLHRYVQGYGTVEPAPATSNAPSADALLSAPVAGVVTRVAVVEGQHVEKGDVLMELNSGTTTLENAVQQVERQKILYAQQNTSLKNLQDAEAQLALLRVTAPLSGTAAHVNVTPGQAVDLTTVLAEVMDLNRLALNAQIPAADAVNLKSGNPAEVLTDPPVRTKLRFVSPDVDKSNSTVLVRALLPANTGLRPGQFVPLRIVTAVHTNCLAAPSQSVVTDESGKSTVAFVQGDVATLIPVQTGLRESGWSEVEAPGLKAGDLVVTVGAYGLPDKTKIRVQNASSGETPANSSNAK